MSDTKASCGMTQAVFIRLVANLFRHESDDHVVSLGDWAETYRGVDSGKTSEFCAAVRLTVGDFRRWAEENGMEFVVGGNV